MKEAQGDFILAKYLPNGVTISQYHHICLKDANALLKHWTQRQAAGEVALRFKKVGKANKQASADDDASTGVGQGVHLAGVPREDGEYREQGDDGDGQGDGEGSVTNEGPDGHGGGGATGNLSNVSQLPTHGDGRSLAPVSLTQASTAPAP
jgi:hypothetical protein